MHIIISIFLMTFKWTKVTHKLALSLHYTMDYDSIQSLYEGVVRCGCEPSWRSGQVLRIGTKAGATDPEDQTRTWRQRLGHRPRGPGEGLGIETKVGAADPHRDLCAAGFSVGSSPKSILIFVSNMHLYLEPLKLWGILISLYFISSLLKNVLSLLIPSMVSSLEEIGVCVHFKNQTRLLLSRTWLYPVKCP